jgi:hypothetical protein
MCSSPSWNTGGSNRGVSLPGVEHQKIFVSIALVGLTRLAFHCLTYNADRESVTAETLEGLTACDLGQKSRGLNSQSTLSPFVGYHGGSHPSRSCCTGGDLVFGVGAGHSENVMSYCGVVEVRSLEDVLGATCGRSAESQCSDCGTLLCSAHTERCQLCGESFCQPCLSFHQREHPKSAHGEQRAPQERKMA